MRFIEPFIKTSSTCGINKNSSPGSSLISVIVGVGLLGISATIISQTVINARRNQRLVEAKLSSNKFQKSILDAIAERTKEFMIEKCSGDRWGGTATTDVQKAFSNIDMVADNGYGLQAVFTTATDLNPQCPNNSATKPFVAAIGTGTSFHFCMEIKPTVVSPGSGSQTYEFSQMDKRVMELLIVPIDIASDRAITCDGANGAGAGMKVVWQIFNQFNNSRIQGGNTGKTITKESGVLLVSAETESYSGTCNIAASRIGLTDQCTVTVSGLGTRPPTLFKNGTRVTAVSWTRPGALDSFTGTTTCPTLESAQFRAQSAAGSDVCDASEIPPSSCLIPAITVGIGGGPEAGGVTHTGTKNFYLPAGASNIIASITAVGMDDRYPKVLVNNNTVYSTGYAGMSQLVTLSPPVQIGSFLLAGTNVFKFTITNATFVFWSGNLWGLSVIVSGSYSTTTGCFTAAEIYP